MKSFYKSNLYLYLKYEWNLLLIETPLADSEHKATGEAIESEAQVRDDHTQRHHGDSASAGEQQRRHSAHGSAY